MLTDILSMDVQIARPSADIWAKYRSFVINALAEQPNFLAASQQVAQARTDEEWQGIVNTAIREQQYLVRFAIDRGSMVGMARLSFNEPGCCYEHVGTVGSLYVSPDYRRQGIAKQLVKHLLNSAQEKKLETILTYVRIDNEASLKLFDSFRFIIRGLLYETAKLRTEYQSTYRDEVILQLKLSNLI
ncbi:MAG: N-acetyltransferase family protein [Thainema sp.]